MTYRGTVQKGVIVLETCAQLPEGTTVEVTPMGRNGKSLRSHPAFGLWRNRPDFSNPAEASLTLRKETERRGVDG